MFSLDQYRAARDAAAFQDRSARARLRLTGADRRTYLQGLLTNDVVALGAGQGCYAALLTAQGRMIADMFIVETGDAVLIDLEPALGDKVCAHLERFIFSEDVQVANVTAETSQIGVFGPGAAPLVASVLADGCRAEDLERLPVLGSRQVQRDGSPLLIVRRDDGSWLMDGGLDLDSVLRAIDTESLLSDDEGQHYHPLGGLAMAALGRVPRTGDVFERRSYRFEVVDMDGNRVDRVLVSRASPASGSGRAADSPRQQD